ncbi:hypothetical protein EV175_003954 [Coemansia sp. RSA 1933]|nr:hypothetical protein EV175_003954 [Coemansia sp. RSA 1933]
MDVRGARKRQRLQLRKHDQNKSERQLSHGDTQNGAEDDVQDMALFGYSARIFSEEEAPLSSRIGLISLEGKPHGMPVLVDRYDIRHLVSLLSVSERSASSVISDGGKLDDLRFATLRSLGDNDTIGETELFDMDPEERRAYIDCLKEQNSPRKRQKSQTSTSGIALQYGASGIPLAGQAPNNGDDSADDKLFVPTFAVPEGIVMPKTLRHFEIIERTARFLADQQDAEMATRMEIMIQGKQGTNADFGFLSRASQLHPFYKHIMWLMRTGLYGYHCSSSSESDTEPGEPEEPINTEAAPNSAQTSQEADDQGPQTTNNHPAGTVVVRIPEAIVVPADSNTRSFIDKVACLVGKSPSPTKLEQKLRVEKATTSTRYAFLLPFSAANKYYCFRRDCYIDGTSESAVEEAVSASICEVQASPAPEPPKAIAGSGDLVQAKRRMLALEFLKAKRRPKNE